MEVKGLEVSHVKSHLQVSVSTLIYETGWLWRAGQKNLCLAASYKVQAAVGSKR